MTPAEFLLGRKLKTRVPEIIPPAVNKKLIQDNNRKRKEQMKQYADEKRKATQHQLKIEDQVLVKQWKTDNLTTPYNPQPYTVIKQHRSIITAKTEDKEITRDASFYKKVNIECDKPAETSDDLCEDIINPQPPAQQEPRRSTRVRKQPSYLEDYVCKNCSN